MQCRPLVHARGAAPAKHRVMRYECTYHHLFAGLQQHERPRERFRGPLARGKQRRSAYFNIDRNIS